MEIVKSKPRHKSAFGHHCFTKCNEQACVDFSRPPGSNNAAQEDTTCQFFSPGEFSLIATDGIECTWNDHISFPTCVLSTSPTFRSYPSACSTPDDQQQLLNSILCMQGNTGSSTSNSMQANDSACESLSELMNSMLEESDTPNHSNLVAKEAMIADLEHEGTMSWVDSFRGTIMDLDGSMRQDDDTYDLVPEKVDNTSITNHTNGNLLLTKSINVLTAGSLNWIEGTQKGIYAQKNHRDDLFCHQENCDLDGGTHEGHNLALFHASVLASQDMQGHTQVTVPPIVPANTTRAAKNNDGLHMMMGASVSGGNEDQLDIRLVHLLRAAAEAIATHNMELAAVILVRLRELVSPMHSTMQRIAAYFTEGFQYRIEGGHMLQVPSLFSNTLYDRGLTMPLLLTSSSFAVNGCTESSSFTNVGIQLHTTQQPQEASTTVKSNYSSNVLAALQALHEIVPHIKFSHLTANQAILEAVQDEKCIHIVDYEIMEGIQWPSLMQALAHRKGGPPQHLRITALWRGTSASKGTSYNSSSANMSSVQETGSHLADFAASLNLPFTFDHVRVDNEDHKVHASALKLVKGEALAVNCMLQLPHMPYRPATSVSSFLESIHKLYPVIVTLGEDELGCNASSISSFFLEALHHYSSMFDSLEACLTSETAVPGMLVERLFLAPRIASWALFCGESAPTPASSTYSADPHANLFGGTLSAASRCNWHTLARTAGFTPLPLSFRNVSQARLLLGLFTDGFTVQKDGDRLVLEWHFQPLIGVSAWSG